MMKDQEMRGLYSPAFEHDNCGIGAVVNKDGKKSHLTVERALHIVENLEHRAGKDAEGKTGDGVGIMLQISHKFFSKVCKKEGILIGGEREYGVAQLFLPGDELKQNQARKMFEIIVEKEGMEFLGWREVPVFPDVLGQKARSCMPCIVQAFIKKPEDVEKGLDFDRRLYIARRVFEQSSDNTYVVSMSSRTIVYKGMFLVGQLRAFFADLQDPDYESAMATVHSRFSTNTNPSWERAHPNRLIVHNGEINTIRGNADKMRAREENMASGHLKGQLHKILPVVNREGYSHMIVPVGNDGTFIISLGNDVFRQYYLNIFYALFICMVLISYGMFFRFASPKEYRLKGSLQARIRNNVIYLIVGLAVLMTVLSVLFNTLSFEQRHRSRMIDLSRYVVSELEDFNTMDSNEDRRINQVLSNMYDISGVDVNIYDWQGRLVSTSRAFIFENGLDGFLLNPKAYQQIVREGNLRLVQYEEIGEIHYRSVYVPLELTNGKRYVVNIPYFTQSGELNMDILLIIVISVNIAVVVVVLAFALASIVAGRVTKPLQLVNDRLSQMKLGEKNEKISYDSQDEVGEVIKAYNNMVDKLSDSMKKLARSEREGAWMGMARQIAHEIKNPLTPMKLNLQFLQRAMRNDNPEELRRRVMNVSAVLIEQIDYMTSIASAFSDFSRLQVMNRELFNLSEQVDNCVRLFAENVDSLQSDVVPGVFVYGDKEQMNRVIVNVLKNAVQSIPEEREGRVGVRLYTEEGHVVLSIKDNGSGIPENIRDHVMEPNFTTKTKGTGLGLAMSYKIIENMGGTITFESKEGVGTIFYITLKYSEKD